MKKFFALLVAALVGVAFAQESATDWAAKNEAVLKAAKADCPAVLKQGKPALDALFAQIKTDGGSDAVASVKIGALSEYVMTAPAAERALYTDALLDAARQAKEPDVVCFFLNQLRWCGRKEQAAGIRAFEKNPDTSVAELAAIAAYAVEGDVAPKREIRGETPCGRFTAEVAALSGEARTQKLMAGLDNGDRNVRASAMQALVALGAAEPAQLWIDKLEMLKCPVRAMMLMDALTARREKAAFSAIAARVTGAEEDVAKVAARDAAALDPEAFGSLYAEALKSADKREDAFRLAALGEAAKSVPTAALVPPMVKAYDAMPVAGRRMALALFALRGGAEVNRLAVAELANAKLAGPAYKVLRTSGGPAEAEAILKSFATTKHAEQAELAYAAIARRDAAGQVGRKLIDWYAAAPAEAKGIGLATMARIGGEPMLAVVGKAAGEPALASAAVCALTDWADAGAVPLLMRSAVTAASAKDRTLALRALTSQLGAKGLDKAPFRTQWNACKASLTGGDAANKQAIEDLLK